MSERDDMDELKRLLAETPPPAADPAARKRAMAAGLAAFEAGAQAAAGEAEAAARAEDEIISTNLQGTSDEPRQRVRQTGLMTQIRRRLMNLSLPSTKHLMMGGASIAVLTIAVIAAQNQYRGIGSLTAPEAGKPIARQEAEPVPPRGAQAPELARPQDRFADDAVRDSVRRETDALVVPMPGRIAEEAAETDAAAPAESLNAPSAPATSELRLGLRGEAESGGAAASRKSLAKPAPGTLGQFSESRARAVPLAPPPATEPAPAPDYEDMGRDRFPDAEPNQVKLVTEEPVSTFSVDVDTASYAFMRKALNDGVLPAKDSIRIEELINYFPYDYRAPGNAETPFAADVTVMDTPWNAGTRLMRIGIKGYEIRQEARPRSNLVFLIDTSGSMNSADKIGLLIQSFEMLLETLGENDTVSIVAYAGSAGTVLEPTKASDKARIRAALVQLRAGGSTAGGEGIRLAYDLAAASFDPDGVNRVILATDGDFNVGIQNTEELEGFIERKRETGVFLSVLGFGRGNYNDTLMQALAQNGNGQAAFIDTLNEARKVLVDEATSTLFPIAKDVKIQVDFNPNVVAEYRLIGYETRMLNREDFNNDKIDAAEIGSGHTVTALYEITPVGSDAQLVEPSRYERAPAATDSTVDHEDEYAFVKIRYKQPDSDTSQLITRPVTRADEVEPDDDARFAAAVAAFGQILKGGRYTGDFGFDDVISLANGAKGADPFNYRGEFVQLVRQAKTARAMERR